jgi:hypothetical protein
LSTQRALVPVGSGEEISAALFSLLDRAKGQLETERGDEIEAGEAEAEITLKMLCLSEKDRGVQRAAQSFVITYVARNQLWRFHPEGFTSLRQFVKAAGLSHGTEADLVALGDVLVPYFDAHAIEIGPYLADAHWGKLREAIPALRRAIKNNDEQTVTGILTDVRTATDRNAVRHKYRKRRQRYGHGTTHRLGDGRILLVAIVDDEEAIQTVIRRAYRGRTTGHRQPQHK